MSLTFLGRLARTCAQPSRSFRIIGSSRYLATKPAPSFPVIPDCPSPTCNCAPTPALPEDLPIDHKTTLNGLISNYAQQVLVCTGKDDWPSKIETEDEGDNLAADLRKLIGPKGVYSDPFHNISVLNASFPSTPSVTPSTSAYILPEFKYVPNIPRSSSEALEGLVKAYLLPEPPPRPRRIQRPVRPPYPQHSVSTIHPGGPRRQERFCSDLRSRRARYEVWYAGTGAEG